jgi:transposase
MARKNVTQSVTNGDRNREMPVWVGIDVHKNSLHIALKRQDGWTSSFVTTPDYPALLEKIKSLAPNTSLIAYEAGPTGFALARFLEKANMPVIVVAPSKTPRPVTRGAKTDSLDCRMLADFASKGILQGISIPTQEEETQRSLVRRRHDLAQSLRRVKQRIRSHLLFLGIPEPKEFKTWSQAALKVLEKLPLPLWAKQTLNSLLREYAFLEKELKILERQLQTICRQKEHREVVACLRSVFGVGPLVSATFRLELFAPERFDRSEEVTSYLGLAPMVRQSGEGKPRGSLVPCGQTRLRSLLVEAAWRWKSKDTDAQRVYRRILGASGCVQKAIVAVARKLAIILWRLSVERRCYEIKTAAV